MDFKPKLMAFDLDGTLAESKQPLSPAMGDLLGDLLAHMPVAVMSGAGFPQFERQFLPPIPDQAHLDRLYIFPNNAARCFIFKNGSWQSEYDHAFTTIEKARIMQALKESLDECGLTEPPAQVWGERIEDRGAQISFSFLGQQAPVAAKQEWYDKRNDERKKLRDSLLKRLNDFSISMGGLTTIDITRKGLTKAYGIHELVKLTDISVSEMLYVGDALEEGGNDAVVLETGVQTEQVFGPDETISLIKEVIRNSHPATI
jgi:phosphomannomutase